MQKCNALRDLIKQPTCLTYYKKTYFYIRVRWHKSCFLFTNALCGAAQSILVRTCFLPDIIVKRSILIYSMILVFVSGGFTVLSNHRHFQNLSDTKDLQTVCHYLKNPVVTNPAPIIFALSIPLLLPVIYCITLFKTSTPCPFDPPSFKHQRLIALSSFPHRAPPER
jgi:hypothetical protein